MTTLLSAQSVCYDNTFGPLLADISFGLKKGDRIGLIGHNGSGKSTLLKILSGDLYATSGTITTANQCLMARVEQHLPVALAGYTLLDAVLHHLPNSLYPPERWQAEVLLVSLGFDEAAWELTAGTLSGGQHTRLLLARALIRQPDLLLLDEPSNHLDLPTLLWLEQFLLEWAGSFVLVSHDRILIEQSCNRFWLIDQQRLEEWHDLTPVYAILADKSAPETPPSAVLRAAPITLVESEEERLLATLLALESKLEGDLARKPRHQKPELQRQWQQKITQLNTLLGLV
ncbi:ABC transporter family protein [Yersinia aldovae 670-83]|nr:ATP-binding cassette domain-containing protein [Yersinia aldovae]AJJ61773.1 ABC transporter family protein [Yersinia aldovae 670-83]